MVQRSKNKYDIKFGDIAIVCSMPDRWEIKRLGFLFTFGKGLGITKEDLRDEGIPCVSYGEVHSKYGFEVNPEKNLLRCVDEKYLMTNKKSLLKYGDFLFADTSEDLEGSGNFTYLNSNTKTFAGYHTIILRPKGEMNCRYVAYLFDSILFRTQISSKVWGIKVYSITQSILKNAKMILPPPKEQTAIAASLDARCRRIDRIITEMEQQIEVLKQYKTSLITETVTKGLDKTVPMKNSGIKWIGDIPAKWEVKRLKYFADICNGTDYSEIATEEGGYPVFGSGGVFARAVKYHYDKPSVLFGRKGTIDKVLYIDSPFWCSDTVFYTKIYTSVFPKYFYYLATQIHFDYYSTATTLPSMTQRDLGSAPLPLPPPKEQTAIAAFLDAQCRRINHISAEKQQAVETMKAYKKSLIYEYVTGKKREKGYL